MSFSVTLPDGTVLDSDVYTADLSAMSGEQAVKAASQLALLPQLRSVDLGSERSGLTPADTDAIRALLPGVELHLRFTLYGKQFDLADSTLNLRYIPVEDNGAAVRAVIGHMPNLRKVDMDSCGLDNETMEKLNQDFPDVKVIWRIWFGTRYSVRTDVEMILASRPTVAGMLWDDEAAKLYYCHDVKYLDIGHNGGITDIGFLRGMPKLEVAILAMGSWSDASPLADCPKLEYLEAMTSRLHDLTPFQNLHNLKHLNICYDFAVTDISPLYGLDLERLWIGQHDPVPPEQIEHYRELHPNCVVNDTTPDPTEEYWRFADHGDEMGNPMYDPRYALLREQMGYQEEAYPFYWTDPLYDYSCPREVEEDPDVQDFVGLDAEYYEIW